MPSGEKILHLWISHIDQMSEAIQFVIVKNSKF